MTRRAATWGLVVVSLVWGISFTIIKLTLDDVTPIAYLAVRFALASVLVAGWWRGITRAELRAGLILGLLFWGGFVFQTTGLTQTTPSRSAFITGLSTPLVPIVAYAAFRAVPRARMIVGMGLAAIGMYLLTGPGGGGLNRGDLLTLGCAALFAAQIVATGHFAPTARPERLLAVELTLTAVLSALTAPMLERPHISLDAGVAAALVFLSITAVLTFGWQLRAQREMTAPETALIFTLEPVFAALASYLVLGERLSAIQLAGGALILLGTAFPLVSPLPILRTIQTRR